MADEVLLVAHEQGKRSEMTLLRPGVVNVVQMSSDASESTLQQATITPLSVGVASRSHDVKMMAAGEGARGFASIQVSEHEADDPDRAKKLAQLSCMNGVHALELYGKDGQKRVEVSTRMSDGADFGSVTVHGGGMQPSMLLPAKK